MKRNLKKVGRLMLGPTLREALATFEASVMDELRRDLPEGTKVRLLPAPVRKDKGVFWAQFTYADGRQFESRLNDWDLINFPTAAAQVLLSRMAPR